jgi:NAD(P)-dependent dehydrogenase (short-subunit alcohol dehydrogenase family)
MNKPGNRLAGKVAIVTGAGSTGTSEDIIGIGVATARLLAQAGAAVAVVDRDPQAGQRTVDLIASDGGIAALIVADVSESGSCRESVAETKSRFGSPDILVNNAAVTSSVQGDAMTEEEWTRVVDINLKGAMFMSRWALTEMMPQRRGSIINMASGNGLRSFGSPAYAASKSGILGMTVDLAGTHGRHGIRVNAIIPGMVYTPMAERIDNTERGRELRRLAVPLAAEGSGWDVAWAVLFFAGDESKWITGTALPVDGGMLISATLPTLPFINAIR